MSFNTDDPARFLEHSRMSNPGRWADRVRALAANPADLCKTIQGLLIHDYYHTLLGVSFQPDEMPSRATEPLERRLEQIFSRDQRPLSVARDPSDRTVGTCRDFALMLCGIFREHRIPARVRCGFANYFAQEIWEDHWICEHWNEASGHWLRADAQIDDAHKQHFDIRFDVSNMPTGSFLTGTEAWRRCRTNPAVADRFQKGGEASGLWFVGINLIRDVFSVGNQEVTAWDGWRTPAPEERRLSKKDREQFDRIASDTEGADVFGRESLNRFEPAWL